MAEPVCDLSLDDISPSVSDFPLLHVSMESFDPSRIIDQLWPDFASPDGINP